MKTNQRVVEIIRRLKKKYPLVKIPLHFANPLELLVATILSAQCTDERVNIVTQTLFKKYRTLDDYARARQQDLEADIHSTGFFRNKAKNIIGAARMLRDVLGGNMPRTMEEIIALPGVARKTGNIVLGHGFGIVEGIAVDTHVLRISRLLGLTTNETPEKIEQDLMKIVPKSEWLHFSLLLQTLGRDVCKARARNHAACVLSAVCPSSLP
ncbi:MAG: endonuclease III [Elusimicrobia bacterium]|nr:endonuclease III [Elusimicrobiota bacterium]